MTQATEPRFSPEYQPFLEQGRAQNTLRHELETLFTAVESSMDVDHAGDDGAIVELSIRPNRIIARRGAMATSFSWLGGRLGGIADGRLLVIQWWGIASNLRGALALKSATSFHETAYRPEAPDAASWCWRAGDAAGAACSTRELVGEWLR